MDPLQENRMHVSRREFFGRNAMGLGTAALAGLLGRDGFAATPDPGLSTRMQGLPGRPRLDFCASLLDS